MMSPQKPKRQGFGLPNTSSMTARIVIVGGGLLLLLIIFFVIKGLFSGGSNLNLYVGIAQDQEVIAHIAAGAGRQQNISPDDLNFAANAQYSLTSSKTATVKYLADNHIKVSPKVMVQKVSTSTDTQLANAAAAGNYDQTFQQVMKSQLASYENDLAKTYKQTNGKKGHALLTDDYNQAQLLLKQLNAASPQSGQ